MPSPSVARASVPAETSEFFRAELEAFAAMAKRDRPAAWRRVQQLQQVCRIESPATAAGRDLAAKTFEEAASASAGVIAASEVQSNA
jgi:hypothetical protein